MKGIFKYGDDSVATYKNNPPLRRDCLFSGAEKETLAVLLLAALLLRLLGLLFLCHIIFCLSAKFDPHLRNNAKMRLLIHYCTA